MYCSCHIRVCGEVRSVVARLSFVSSRAKTRRASATGGIWGGRERGRKGGGDPGRTYPRARCRRRGRSSSSSRRGRLRGGEGERGMGQSGCGRDEAASSRETRPGVGCAPRGGARPTPGRAGRARRGETHRRECPPSRVCFATQEGGIATCDGVNGEPRAEIFFSGRPSRRVRDFPLFLCALKAMCALLPAAPGLVAAGQRAAMDEFQVRSDPTRTSPRRHPPSPR